MDITIPPYNLKRFTASITCLGKIGKDLYLSFDPLDGLTLSSLNEAKSAYGKFHFEPRYFERCSAPPVVGGGGGGGLRGGGGGGSGDEDDDEECYDTRYVCRVPVRSVHSILRPRKGVCSLRIRSEGTDDKGNYFGLNKKKRKKRSHRGHRSGEGDDDDDERRGSLSARERRKRRKQIKSHSNRRSEDDAAGDDDDDDEDPANSISLNTEKMMLSFEFFIELPAPKRDPGDNGAAAPGGGSFRVLHKVGVTDANGITLSASVSQSRTRSEVVTPPRLWLRLLDPLRRTVEAALTIDDELGVVTATSFHPGEVRGNAELVGEENAVLRAAAARNAALKTETSTGVEEFTEYDFRNNRGKNRKRRRRRRERDDEEKSEESGNEEEEEEEDDEYDFEKESERPPLDVNKKVILVFSIKEAKAMLQFCAQTNSIDDDGVILSFHWGGKPIVIETDGDFFSAELVLATLHHGMIASNITVGGGGDDRRASGNR